MNEKRTWTSYLAGILLAGFVMSVGYLILTGGWWSLRGASPSGGNEYKEVVVEAMLTDAQASQVRQLTKKLLNPAEATEAVAQIRDHFDRMARENSESTAPSMALFIQCLAPRFESLDSQTRQICLVLMSEIFGWYENHESNCWTALLSPSQGILGSSVVDTNSDVVKSSLHFIRACWEWAPPDVKESGQKKALGTWKAELHAKCVELMKSKEESIRGAAGVDVVTVPLYNAAARGLVLLQDDSPVVRRTVLMALGDRPELLSSEDVVGFLRDSSASVRNAAESVLIGRELTREQIELAKRATDPSPLVRAQVPLHIVESTAVDRVVWLNHLSHDATAAVRIEAARALAAVGEDECRLRLREMSQVDPDAEVRRVARSLVAEDSSAAAERADLGGLETMPILSSPHAN